MAVSIGSQRRAILLLAAASLACAPAGREGEVIDIAEESAIILWDATAKTQHFIRRASFRTEAKDFGFLVPTPSVPELKEAEDDAFDFLDRLTDPPERRMVAKSEPAKGPARAAAAPKVEVIAKVRVAGYDAAVLKANDAGALDGWLKTNDYASSPELREWYKPYIAKAWIITAFKIAGDADRPGRVKASAVRMTFKTDRPFFPYREPAGGKASAPRLLHVYFLGDARPEGKIGDGGAWPGRATWSGTIGAQDRNQLLNLLKLPESAAGTAARLTRFIDGSSPRPGGDDLFFMDAADQSEVRVASVVYPRGNEQRDAGNSLPWWALAVGIAALGFWYYRRKRQSAPKRDPVT